ncbi:hypothetical protein [Carboxylicivirga taeanensis]|uniref:hypothetical protein n=1 Tax=Carboxylicivirga taeanensis TaxID=1416875 RepID=UPI003F6DB9A1
MELYRNNRGELVIESLIPGGPAWHSNQFNEGDIIRSIRSDRDSTVELKYIPTKEAVDIIYSDQIRKAVFTIQKMNGEQVESYNKAVAEFNEEIKKYNETNEFTNKKRAKTIEYWNQEVEKFFERNTN